jgi:two-component system nitrogen regulation response regulator GlnG
VVPIEIPALRERTEDIAVLAEHFTARYADELGTQARLLSEPALDQLCAYEWPGNVRELENAIKRALVLASHDVLTPDDFAFLRGTPPPPAEASGSLEEFVRGEVEAMLRGDDPRNVYPRILERTERPLLEAVLAHTGGNQLRAAALLGINRNTLRKKITELGIDIPERP